MIKTVDNRDELIKYCFDILVTEQNEKEIAIDDEEEPSNSSTEIAIQESAQNSSFDVEAYSTLSINNQISNDFIYLIPIQCADSLSDEYSISDEENDERNFDAALTLLHEAKETSQSTDRHQFKINTKFKAAKKVKVNDGRVSSNLIEDSSLKSMNEALDQSLVVNDVQENTSNKVNELTVGDKCDEVKDIQMGQQDNTINKKERMEYSSSESSDADLDGISNKIVNLSQTSNDPEFGEETDALLPNSHSSINAIINTLQAVGIDNQISIDNECVTDNQQAENNGKSIEPMLSDEKVDELLLDFYLQINIAVNTSQTVSTDNQISLENEYATDNQQAENNREMDKQPSINFISGMLEQTTLAENSTQVDDIGSIQDNDYEEDFDFTGNSEKPKQKSTSHNGSSTNDSIEDRVESANFSIVVIENKEIDKYFSSSQKSFTQLDSSQSSISLQDNISDRQISPIITQHEQPNREIVNEDSSSPKYYQYCYFKLLGDFIPGENRTSILLIIRITNDKYIKNTENKIDNSQVIPLDINTVQTYSSDDNWETDSQEKVDIRCQIRNIYRQISDRGTNFNNARVQYILSLCELVRISYELTKKVKELKKDNKFTVSRFIEVKDQETGWNVISKSKRIDPIRLKVMPKSKWEDLIKNIKEKYSVNTDYKLIEKSLKEVEDNF
ncbi:13992_t:CDS:10 [Cetraspora pellucida]|uniref:13992_t:CDS:1 n=1 Tax=Cetraspora pellucida TaxID=1433469 RepID=A0A9N9DK86_9GLOM|nr:13992_t:CDS:10 [Cetraspora pellucida]